ncbi:Protein of unknown function [Pyronema omphalodes CBS 100304]|uniref:Uncharacterized protein n=1 Tax=Pyronema omphalodes (strain CBS 100304) TaxID=1076935 RepID=U4KVI4_PYROM|nr:Protein of unknown function [Pyronema omphalodes CBS 100304]
MAGIDRRRYYLGTPSQNVVPSCRCSQMQMIERCYLSLSLQSSHLFILPLYARQP